LNKEEEVLNFVFIKFELRRVDLKPQFNLARESNGSGWFISMCVDFDDRDRAGALE
jgi:hypothetical protein